MTILLPLLLACAPSGAPATSGTTDPGTGAPPTLVEGSTRIAERNGTSMLVRAYAGEVGLPVEGGSTGLAVSSFWGGAQPVGEDGHFLLEMPADGTSLVLLSDSEGQALAQVLFAAHEDIVDSTIHMDASHVVASSVYASSVLRASDPRWSTLLIESILLLPEAQEAAAELEAGLLEDPSWLRSQREEWSSARAGVTQAFQDQVSAWAVAAGEVDPFGEPAGAIAWAAASSSGADDDEDEGQFEPQAPGAARDGVTVSTEWADEQTVQLSLTNHEGRWVLPRLDGELVTEAILPPTTFKVPDPVGFTVSLGFFFLDQMYENGMALYYGSSGPDSWEELQDWLGGQVGRADPRSVGIYLDAGDQSTLTLGGYGCGDEQCPTWGDDQEADWVPSLVLTVLTEIVFPLMDFFEIEVAGSVGEEQLGQCVSHLESDLAVWRTLTESTELVMDAVRAGDLTEIANRLDDLAWEIMRSDELWACFGIDAFWTEDAITKELRDLIEKHADELDVTGVGISIEATNTFISVVYALNGLQETSARGEYLLYGPELVEICGDGVDNDVNGDADCWDDACIGTAACVSTESSGGISLSLVTVSPLTFDMGCNTAETSDCADDEYPVHAVTLTRTTLLGRTEITRDQFSALLGYDPSTADSTQDSPVEDLTWYEAAAFTNALSEASGLEQCYSCSGEGAEVICEEDGSDPLDCTGYRLPTEAEWEAAARCGEDYLYAGADQPDAVGWFEDNSAGAPHPVASLAANRCGFYDLSGNVWEWAQDWFDPDWYGSSPGTDPICLSASDSRSHRGGGWDSEAQWTRVTNRGWDDPPEHYPDIGLRVARTAP